MARTLVLRLSALGDVAILIPALYSVAVRYPKDEFLLVIKSPLISLFELRPANVHVIPVFTKGKHKGIFGIWKLIRELSKLKINQIADMHNVLRSRQITLFFRLMGKKVAVIDKGKTEKKALTRKHNKIFVPLKTSTERYQDIFNKLGYNFSVDFKTLFDFGKQDLSLIEPFAGQKTKTWIGVAPFAKHTGKIYPLQKMDEVIKALAIRPNTNIFLFGGKEEADQLKKWENQYPDKVSIVAHASFTTELLLMSYLDVMLTMDSANMHLASLVGITVVSIWGATHPYAGFYGYGQKPENAVQIELYCRPCSVFGNKPCYRKDYACLNWITVPMVLEKIESNLKLKQPQ